MLCYIPSLMLVVRKPALVARQSSPFSFTFFDADQQKVGSLRFPDFAAATNARLKPPAGIRQQTEIVIGADTLQIEFEYLDRAWINDLEYRLKRGSETLASATWVKSRARQSQLSIQQPFNADLHNKSTWLGIRNDLVQNKQIWGSIFERGFTVNRRVWIDLPSDLPLQIQCFLFFLVYSRSIGN